MSKNGNEIGKKPGFMDDDVQEVGGDFDDDFDTSSDFGSDFNEGKEVAELDVEDVGEQQAGPLRSFKDIHTQNGWLHGHLMSLVQSLGMSLESGGLCYGISITGLFAFLRGENARQAFVDSLVGAAKTTEEEIKLTEAKIQQLLKTRLREPLEIKIQEILDKMRGLNPRIDQDESVKKETIRKIESMEEIKSFRKQILDEIRNDPKIKKYYDVIGLLQNVKLNFDLERYGYLAPKDTKFEGQFSAVKERANISEPDFITQKQRDEEGLVEHARYSHDYTKSGLLEHLNSLMHVCHQQHAPIGLMLSNLGHAICCGYDPEIKQWFFLDANQQPIYDSVSATEIRDAIWEGLATDNNHLVITTQAIMTETMHHSLQRNAEQNKMFTGPISEDELKTIPEEKKGEWLLASLYAGLEDTAWFLLNNGVNVNVKDDEGGTPLLFAAKNGNLKLVEALLEKGANTETVSNKNLTPLLIAINNGHTEVALALLNKNARVSMVRKADISPLLLAVQNDNLKVVEALLKKNASVNEETSFGMSPFLSAIKFGRTDIVKIFLEHNANIEAVNEKGDTGLLIAVKNGNKDIVKLLLDHNADMKAKNDKGQDAASIARKNGNVDVLEMITTAQNDSSRSASSTRRRI